jgi:lipopolysaccharide transport system ATP-binding protein
MGNEPAIVVDHVSKMYHKRAGMGTLFSMLPGRRRRESDEFWALKDVSFEVKKGECLGIIGPNGAGKSTILKILSRITSPTSGSYTVNGRVGSLLEVGTGFHPELTGSENIYLCGAILGMGRREISAKFDEIVDFSGVEEFIDTPVKRYSSGMRVRLGFAVAAHLDPEILLIDEVLAVGDAAFQEKCLGKMDDVTAREGRTILFVSHNLGAISSLTSRTLWLDHGGVAADAATPEAVRAYMEHTYPRQPEWRANAENIDPMQILAVGLDSPSRPGSRADFRVDEDVRLHIEYVVREPVRGAVIAANIHAQDGSHLVSLEDVDGDPSLVSGRRPGRYRTECTLPGGWLNSGTYSLRVGCGIARGKHFENLHVLSFRLIEASDFRMLGHRKGYLVPMLEWRTFGM